MKEQRRIHARHVLSDRAVESAYDQVGMITSGVRGSFAELREKAIAMRAEGWTGDWDDLRGPTAVRANGISATEVVWSLDIEREAPDYLLHDKHHIIPKRPDPNCRLCISFEEESADASPA
jgi:hypothetical protein